MTETISVPGLPTVPWYKKINPIWWFGNDECKPTDSFWYCYLRNPLQNLRKYVLGVADRTRTITGPAPAGLNLWLDDPSLGKTGWKWAITMGFLPYISYSGANGYAFYLGWLPNDGRLGYRMTW